MHHLEISFFHLPYSSKQPGDTWSSPAVMGSPCSWHGVVGFEGHCFALLVEELRFSCLVSPTEFSKLLGATGTEGTDRQQEPREKRLQPLQ